MALEIVFIGVIVLIVLALAFVVLTYNSLITLRNRVDNAWAQIDVQLKRRYDLIPNLVETVKGYMKHERDTLESVTKMRSQLVTGTPSERAKANNMITDALKTIFAVAEDYPKLQASENFKALQEELSGTEDKIAFVRTAYNDNVLAFNNSLQMFPTNIIAGMFGFIVKAYFEAPAAEREAVKVKF
jgi:LemA protein